ncbi:hypothetical protein TAMA11512_04250 [Selenomonas sp. TAMA-11512]|uniref:glycosyltransferase n=1 Tax=Selenomonas sp. TAMA-11512 TaxID=3095337 RepID=UPI003085EE3A|nr:hypothetical protein TAMA11512_04250 [Selenomonas sp. TAMA-11512]
MRIGIFENIMTPGGHEVDFDRILVEELRGAGHEVSFYVPEGFRFELDYGTPVTYLKGAPVMYGKSHGVRKLIAAFTREVRRQGWYRALYEAAAAGEVDALIVPTSTYRYLRALKHSVLRKSPVPIIFILHGINPKEAPKFIRAVESLAGDSNIRPTVLTFGDTIFGERPERVRCIYPPTYTPRDLLAEGRTVEAREKSVNEPLVIGFYGQYRREKRLEDFLRIYLARDYARPVKLLVQGSTMHEEDAADFERIIAKYRDDARVEFLHKGLIGRAWQEAILSVDALLMPYSAPRYRYHWGGMLFTAIGYRKPVIASDDINPEVFERFSIGETFSSGDADSLGRTLEDFINRFDERQGTYQRNLAEAGELYAPSKFAERLVSIIEE